MSKALRKAPAAQVVSQSNENYKAKNDDYKSSPLFTAAWRHRLNAAP
jgi:hypothetical protein